jgi:MFS family permease
MGQITTPTPVPYKLLVPLCLVYFIESFVLTNIFSYVGFMVLDFNLTNDPDKVGYYAGYIGSTFSIAGFLSSFWWGRLSDRYGRRPILLFGCVGGLISNLLFGFSKSLEMAIATRFAAGVLNGNIGVVKGYAADVCDKTNQVKGVGILQLGWALGGIIGPLIGGILARPCTEFKNFCSEGSIFWSYPYLLPNLFSCAVSVIAIITLIFFLPKDDKRQRQGNVEMKQLGVNEFSIGDDTDMTSGLTDTEMSDESTSPSQHFNTGKLRREDSMTKELLAPSILGWREKLGIWWDAKTKDKNSIFSNKIAMLTALSYAILGGAFTMLDEGFPLFSMSKVDKGGLGFTTTDIGAVGAINGVASIFVQVVLFYPAATKLGFVRLFRFGLALAMLIFAIYPVLHYALYSKPVLWASIAAITFLRVIAGNFSFSSVTAMVSNSCSLSQTGSINGFAQSLVALMRIFSPAIAGNLLAWGFTSGYGFPLNQYFGFITSSVVLGISLAVTFALPRSLDFPYIDPTITKTKQEENSIEGEGDGDNYPSSADDEKNGEKASMILKDTERRVVVMEQTEDTEEFSVE